MHRIHEFSQELEGTHPIISKIEKELDYEKNALDHFHCLINFQPPSSRNKMDSR
jgi:hypothetical protein